MFARISITRKVVNYGGTTKVARSSNPSRPVIVDYGFLHRRPFHSLQGNSKTVHIKPQSHSVSATVQSQRKSIRTQARQPMPRRVGAWTHGGCDLSKSNSYTSKGGTKRD